MKNLLPLIWRHDKTTDLIKEIVKQNDETGSDHVPKQMDTTTKLLAEQVLQEYTVDHVVLQVERGNGMKYSFRWYAYTAANDMEEQLRHTSEHCTNSSRKGQKSEINEHKWRNKELKRDRKEEGRRSAFVYSKVDLSTKNKDWVWIEHVVKLARMTTQARPHYKTFCGTQSWWKDWSYWWRNSRSGYYWTLYQAHAWRLLTFRCLYRNRRWIALRKYWLWRWAQNLVV